MDEFLKLNELADLVLGLFIDVGERVHNTKHVSIEIGRHKEDVDPSQRVKGTELKEATGCCKDDHIEDECNYTKEGSINLDSDLEPAACAHD